MFKSIFVVGIVENAKGNVEFKPLSRNADILLHFTLDECPLLAGQPIRCRPILLDNKYYTANIYLVELNRAVQFPNSFYDLIHGALIYFDNNNPEELTPLEEWTNLIGLCSNCSVRILSCETLTDSDGKLVFWLFVFLHV